MDCNNFGMDLNNFIQGHNALMYSNNNTDGNCVESKKIINKFNEIINEHKNLLQDFILNNNEFINSLKDRTISMLFLDKFESISGKFHPNNLFLDELIGEKHLVLSWGYSYISYELIKYLFELKKNPLLSTKTESVLNKWIVSEKEYISLGLVFDGWFLKNKGLLEIIKSTLLKLPSEKFIEQLKSAINPPPIEEVNALTNYISDYIKNMNIGDYLKVPAGTLLHTTKLKVIKKNQDEYELYHYNTGEGAIQILGSTHTACRYAPISSKILENPEFWKKIVFAKYQINMSELNNILNELKINPQEIESLRQIPLQMKGSCSFKAAIAEFKDTFTLEFDPEDSFDNAEEEYKKCKSLMILHAKENEISSINPKLARMLIDREKIAHRYLDWLTIIKDDEKFLEIKNSYIEALSSFEDRNLVEIAFKGFSKDKNNLKSLNLLDKFLNTCLTYTTYNIVETIREKFGKDCTFNGINYLGLTKLIKTEYKRDFFGEIIKSKEESNVDYKLNSKINSEEINKIELKNELTRYVKFNETPLISETIIKNLFKNDLIDMDYLNDLKNELKYKYYEYFSGLSSAIDKLYEQDIDNKIESGNDEDVKDIYLLNISKKIMIENKNMDLSIKYIEMIKNEKHKRVAIENFIKLSCAKINTYGVLKIINIIKDEEYIDGILEYAANRMCDFDELEKSELFINQIKNEGLKDFTFYNIATRIHYTNVHQALKFITNIKSQKLKDIYFYSHRINSEIIPGNREGSTQV